MQMRACSNLCVLKHAFFRGVALPSLQAIRRYYFSIRKCAHADARVLKPMWVGVLKHAFGRCSS